MTSEGFQHAYAQDPQNEFNRRQAGKTKWNQKYKKGSLVRSNTGKDITYSCLHTFSRIKYHAT